MSTLVILYVAGVIVYGRWMARRVFANYAAHRKSRLYRSWHEPVTAAVVVMAGPIIIVWAMLYASFVWLRRR